MPNKSLRLLPEAATEIAEAVAWYALRSHAASREFFLEIEYAFGQITEHPDRWPTLLRGARRFRMHRFPFHIVYLQRKKEIEIVAVAHDYRKPGYWKNRVR